MRKERRNFIKKSYIKKGRELIHPAHNNIYIKTILINCKNKKMHDHLKMMNLKFNILLILMRLNPPYRHHNHYQFHPHLH